MAKTQRTAITFSPELRARVERARKGRSFSETAATLVAERLDQVEGYEEWLAEQRAAE